MVASSLKLIRLSMKSLSPGESCTTRFHIALDSHILLKSNLWNFFVGQLGLDILQDKVFHLNTIDDTLDTETIIDLDSIIESPSSGNCLRFVVRAWIVFVVLFKHIISVGTEVNVIIVDDIFQLLYVSLLRFNSLRKGLGGSRSKCVR